MFSFLPRWGDSTSVFPFFSRIYFWKFTVLLFISEVDYLLHLLNLLLMLQLLLFIFYSLFLQHWPPWKMTSHHTLLVNDFNFILTLTFFSGILYGTELKLAFFYFDLRSLFNAYINKSWQKQMWFLQNVFLKAPWLEQAVFPSHVGARTMNNLYLKIQHSSGDSEDTGLPVVLVQFGVN